MSYPWDSAIRRLRRRAMVSGALAVGGRVLLPTALAAVAVQLAGRWSPWARLVAPYLAAAAAVVLLAALALGAVWARRSDVYFAKWIDIESGLEDRLASALEWSRLAEPDPFRARCIEQLALDLGAGKWRLVLPRTRPRRLGLGLLAALAVSAAAVVQIRQPAAPLERDAHRKFEAVAQVLGKATGETQTVKGEAQTIGDPALEQMATDLSSLVQSIAQGQADRETVLAQMERLRERARAIERRAGALSQPGTHPTGGPVGALASALGRGDPHAVSGALEEAMGALKSGGLSDEESAALEPLLRGLGEMARPVDPGLASQLDKAAERLQAGDQAATAATLAGALKQLPELDKPLAALAAARRIESVLASLDKGTGEVQAAQGEAGRAPTLGDDRGNPAAVGTPSSAREGGGEAGSQAAAEHERGAAPDGTAQNALRLTGVWSGKVVRQLFEGQHSAAPTDEVKQLFVEHERVVEDRFRADEVPREYQDAVRIYFAALHQKESSWTQTRK